MQYWYFIPQSEIDKLSVMFTALCEKYQITIEFFHYFFSTLQQVSLFLME